MRTYGRLREKIREVYGTIGAFAEAMDMDRGSLSNKLNGKSAWTNHEIEKACMLLGISIALVPDYFFYD